MRPRILFVRSWIAQQPPASGADQRLTLLEQAMADLGEVTFYQAQAWGERGKWPLYPHTKRVDWACLAAACCRNLPAHRPGGRLPADLAALRPESFDIIFFHRLAAVWWTGLSNPRRAILDLDDLPSQHFRQRVTGNPLARAGKWWRYRRVRATERRMLDAFRFALVCSQADREYLDHPHVALVPNCYWPSPAMQQPPDADPAGCLLFVGALFYRPNVTGLLWFVREVLPLIRRQMPTAGLQIVGRMPNPGQDGFDPALLRQPGVELIGTVPDVAPYVQRCKLEICPILEGGGTRIKILESLAFGKPVVSTTLGAYGQAMGEQQGLIRRDEPAAFAAACVELLKDAPGRIALGRTGREYVQANFSAQTMRSELARMVETILREHGRAE